MTQKLLDFLFPDDASNEEIARTCDLLDRAGISPDAVLLFDRLREQA